MRIRPTELGWKGFLLQAALVTSFLASNYNNLFFLLIVFCSVLGGLGLLWSWTNLRAVTGASLDLPIAAAGEPRPVQLTLQLRRGVARGIVVALVLEPEVVEVGDAFAIGPAGHVAGKLPPRPRSIDRVHAVRLSSRFPFGLFRARVEVPVHAELITHPQPLPGRHRRARGGDGDESLAAVAGERSRSVAGLRPFRDGDQLGDVHWKATARRGQPIVRERELDAGGRLDFVLDRRCAPDVLESALSRLAGHVFALRGSGRTLVVHSQGGGFTLRTDRRSETEALRWLANAAALPPQAGGPPHVPGARRLPHPANGGNDG